MNKIKLININTSFDKKDTVISFYGGVNTDDRMFIWWTSSRYRTKFNIEGLVLRDIWDDISIIKT